MRFDAIIFDCDGVLVESEGIATQVVLEMTRELGHTIHIENAEDRFRGRKLHDNVAMVEEMLGVRFPETFVADARARMADVFRDRLQPVPGIDRVLDAITVPTCVASSGPIEKIEVTLGVTGMLERFRGRIFSGYALQTWKPAPDLFLHAARALGAAPERCAVVEDSEPGVRAGVAAGMSVFHYVPGHPEPEAPEPGVVRFGDMGILLDLLAGRRQVG
ncbi:MAG: HAD-IA family hydrolase [Ectothiorhodospiraceae bacterium]|nr:HAD-IA family hydrolase [Ectothiorhodospiraceae bacterium]